MLYTPAFRKSAYALTTAAVLGMSGLFPQTAQALTIQECKGLAAFAGAYVREQSKRTFTRGFLDSVKAYIAPDGKTLSCSGKTIAVSTIDDLAGWIGIENNARSVGINVGRDITLVLQPGADPKLPQLIAQRDRNIGKQASAAPL